MNGTNRYLPIDDPQQKPSRREIAAMAMQMFLQQTKLLFLGPEYHDREVSAIASVSVKMADALIERLNAEPPNKQEIQ
jgi:hypothetical protein